jgi:hypothetical protein
MSVGGDGRRRRGTYFCGHRGERFGFVIYYAMRYAASGGSWIPRLKRAATLRQVMVAASKAHSD